MDRRFAVVSLLAALPLLAACGGGDAPEPQDGAAGAPQTPVPPRPATAPDQDGRAAFLTLMGEDTLAMEWVSFQNRSVDVQAIIRGTQTMFGDYHLAFAEDGSVRSYRADTYLGTDASGEVLRSERIEEGEEGPELVIVQDGRERRTTLDLEPGSVPFVDMLHWTFEASMRWQMDHRGALGEHVPVFTARGIQEFALEENADGTWELVHPSRGPSTMEVDEEGRILWLDGTGSTRAYDLRRVAYDALDQRSLAEIFRDRPMGELSGRGQIDEEVLGVHFTGHYGEPLKRGREIFGNLVAYGEWWRTGANEATHFSFDRDILIDGDTVPAGDYTLSSIPEEAGGILIINRQTGQGGQSYDAGQDQARVMLRRDRLEETVEAFEIRVREAEDGGRIELRWDDTVYWVPFTVV